MSGFDFVVIFSLHTAVARVFGVPLDPDGSEIPPFIVAALRRLKKSGLNFNTSPNSLFENFNFFFYIISKLLQWMSKDYSEYLVT
jgi:uncharacterized protein YqgV (UPF0045/DUF77 family)